MSIHNIPADKMKNVAPLFDGWDETMIWSCLQGHMGKAWADNVSAPTAAQIITGDFCFFAGDAGLPSAKELVSNIPDYYSRPWILMASKSDLWHRLIEDVYKDKFKKYMRYAFTKEPNVFDETVLHSYIEALPEGYTIARIDEPLYHWTRTEGWARDFCSQFATYKDYRNSGLGYVVLYEGKPVCGASSYTFYDSGIEIEIGTVEGHRRKGLATACAAKLILECLDRELYPSWDAANRESVALALKLGYRFDKEYVTYEVTGFRQESYTYHPMLHRDYDEIYALWQSIPGVGLSEADSRENIETYLSRNPGQSFVCKNGDAIIGTILCGNDGRRAYIHHTAVAPMHRRHGVAAELVRQALEAQRGLGMKKCHLFIFNENELGKAFWSKAGFTERQDIGIMSKNL